MEHTSEKPALAKPVNFFTADFSRYGKVTQYSLNNLSPVFWENDCIIVYVREGSGTLTVNRAPYKLQPGCLAVLHSFHIFQFETTGRLEVDILIFPYPEMTHMVFRRLTRPGDWEVYFHRTCCICLQGDKREKAQLLIEQYRMESELGGAASRVIQSSLLFQLKHIYRTQSGLYRDEPGMPKELLCSDIFLYMSAFCAESLTPQSVAERFNVPVSRLNTELRRLTGHNFWQVLNRARVGYAYSALLHGDMSVRILVKQVGFSSENSLYRAFKEFRGCSPQQLRDKMLGEDGVARHLIKEKKAQIQLYLLQNCREPIDAKTCAADLFMTADSMNQALQEYAGRKGRFQALLTTFRLRYAEGLMAASSLPVCDIAIHSGFNSVHTFIRLFKQKHGVTPTVYRRNLASCSKEVIHE